MDQEIVLAALRLLTRLFEASKALLDLLRQQEQEDGDERDSKRYSPRHLEK